MFLPDGYRSRAMSSVPFNEWHHFACSFIDPDDEDRFQVFFDGKTSVKFSTFSPLGTSSTGSGRVVIGRVYTNVNSSYTSLELDELLFFNLALEEQDVQALYQQYA